MLFKDGVSISELKRESKKGEEDGFVVEFEKFRKEYEGYIKRRSAYHLVAVKPRGKNKLQGLMEPAQRANIEMRATKVGEDDGVIHEYMWAKGMPKTVNGEKLFNATQYYWLWNGSAYLDGKDVEIAFFLEKYSDQFNKIFKKSDPEANAKLELENRKSFSFLDYTLSYNEAICEDRDSLNVIAEAFGVNFNESQSNAEVANAIRYEVAVDLEAKLKGKFDLFKGIVEELDTKVDVPSAQKAWVMDYQELKDVLGASGTPSRESLVKEYCEKHEVEYKDKD